MCPDDALLSAYMDGEVPSPWKERMEAHMSSCPQCRAKLVEYQILSGALVKGFDKEEQEFLRLARSRIAASIDFGAASGKGADSHARLWRDLWSRRIALPMPILAASAAAFVLVFGAAMGVFGSFQGITKEASGSIASASRTITAQSATLELMAQYMKQQSVQPVMIDIPSESVFYQSGNPLIVTESEVLLQDSTTTSYGSASR
ncbi:MAG: zf-HC2 domain-containing protein [Spirochaetia bacterium]|jgi:anti-sigma factor RsiW|nr:zf-HC2 domain-containing protein [Spirochaetia bacterium]